MQAPQWILVGCAALLAVVLGVSAAMEKEDTTPYRSTKDIARDLSGDFSVPATDYSPSRSSRTVPKTGTYGDFLRCLDDADRARSLRMVADCSDMKIPEIGKE